MPSEESVPHVAAPSAAPSYEQHVPVQAPRRPERQSGGPRKKEEVFSDCSVCQGEGCKDNMVKWVHYPYLSYDPDEKPRTETAGRLLRD